MISSASAQIEATGGDHLKTTVIKAGKRVVVPDYATVQGILIGTVAAYIIFLVIIGPEYVSFLSLLPLCLTLMCRNHGSHFEKQGVAFEEDSENRTDYDQHAIDNEQMSDTRFEDIKEKI
jgi:MFS transporter, SHS family, lactate transporter